MAFQWTDIMDNEAADSVRNKINALGQAAQNGLGGGYVLAAQPFVYTWTGSLSRNEDTNYYWTNCELNLPLDCSHVIILPTRLYNEDNVATSRLKYGFIELWDVRGHNSQQSLTLSKTSGYLVKASDISNVANGYQTFWALIDTTNSFSGETWETDVGNAPILSWWQVFNADTHYDEFMTISPWSHSIPSSTYYNKEGKVFLYDWYRTETVNRIILAIYVNSSTTYTENINYNMQILPFK